MKNKELFDKQNKSYKIIRRCLYFVVVVFIFFLLNKLFIFTGQVKYNQDFKKTRENISRIKPSSATSNFIRDIDNNETYQALYNNNGYFLVNIPEKSEKIEIAMEIKNPVNEIFFSVLDKNRQTIKKKVYDNFYNYIPKKWQKLYDSDRNLTLWQKKNDEYKNIDDFLSNPPTENVYFSLSNYNLLSIADYTAAETYQNISWPLRGPHKIYTYIGQNEKMDWEFNYTELGRNDITDPFTLKIYSNSDLINEIYIEDHSESDSYHLELENLSEGIYTIELFDNFDILLNDIKTKQHLFALKDRLNMLDYSQSNEFYIYGSKMDIQVIHSEGLQDIKFDNQNIRIQEAEQKYQYSIDNTVAHSVFIPKSDITIETDGFIYTNPGQNDFIKQIFNYQDIDENSEKNFDSLKYILSDYSEPSVINNQIVLNASFDLTNVQLEPDNKLKININLSDVPPNGFQISNIKVDIYRPFWEYLKNNFINL